MIRPAKHLNLNSCLIRAAACLLSKLQKKRICSYGELKHALDYLGPDSEVLFVPSLHFLFLMGRLHYHPQTDAFEYIQT